MTIPGPDHGTAAFPIPTEDVEYLRHGETRLLLRLYRPNGPGPFPLMIDLHGGAWCAQDRTSDTLFCETLARSGVMVAALDFRMPPAAGYPASLADINYAIRWLKLNSTRLGARGEEIGLIGISSGGHQAMLTALRPRDPRYGALSLRGGEAIDARVACAILIWPVIDPLARYRYARALQATGGTYPPQIDSVIPAHVKFWGDEATMGEGNPVGILERGERVEMPPVLYVQGRRDRVHPIADLERFVAAYRKRGGNVDLALYETEGEGFIRDPASENAGPALARIAAFAQHHLS